MLYPNKVDLISFEISSQLIIIGRNPECDISLRDDILSGEHLSLSGLNGRVFIQDLESSNGTTLNSMPIKKKRQFHLNEEVEIGGGFLLALDRMKMSEKELINNKKPHQGSQPLTLYEPELSDISLNLQDGEVVMDKDVDAEILLDLENVMKKVKVSHYRVQYEE